MRLSAKRQPIMKVSPAFTQAIGTDNYIILRTASGDANVAQWLGAAVLTPNVAGLPVVDITHVLGYEVCD